MFSSIQIEWRATNSPNGDIAGDAELSSQLEEIEGIVTCPEGQQMCTFDITLRQDEDPEFATWFLVELIGVGQGATLNPADRFANVTVADSDYPYGLLQFTTDTRLVKVLSTSDAPP